MLSSVVDGEHEETFSTQARTSFGGRQNCTLAIVFGSLRAYYVMQTLPRREAWVMAARAHC